MPHVVSVPMLVPRPAPLLTLNSSIRTHAPLWLPSMVLELELQLCHLGLSSFLGNRVDQLPLLGIWNPPLESEVPSLHLISAHGFPTGQ